MESRPALFAGEKTSTAHLHKSEVANLLFAVLRPKRSLLRRCGCEKLLFASCYIHDTGTNVRSPNVHKTPPDVGLESCQGPANEASRHKPNLQWKALITDMTNKSIVFLEMNVTSQSSQPLVASSFALCDCSCKCVSCQQNVMTTNSGNIKAFQHTSVRKQEPNHHLFQNHLSSMDGRQCIAFALASAFMSGLHVETFCVL